jgi:hypothetical protein
MTLLMAVINVSSSLIPLTPTVSMNLMVSEERAGPSTGVQVGAELEPLGHIDPSTSSTISNSRSMRDEGGTKGAAIVPCLCQRWIVAG